MMRTAEISPDGKYRYSLSRVWDWTKDSVVWIMLNPSTADANKDDATIRRCVEFSKREGYGRMIVYNLFAYRATDPKELWRAPNPLGDGNDWHLLRIASDARIIAAWGAQHHPLFYFRRDEVRAMLNGRLWCLGKTMGGHPKHPVRLSKDTPLEKL